MTPKLSIVSVTYKDLKGLEATLESLRPLMSLPLTWEHIVVDSSPEESQSAFGRLSKKWPLVRIKIKPLGIYSAQNAGAAEAKGDILWFLNGGDKLKSLASLKAVLTSFEGDPELDVLCAAAELYRKNEYLYTVVPHNIFIRNLIGKNSVCHQAVFLKRSSFKKVGFFDTSFKIAADYEHHWRSVIAGLKFLCISNPIVCYDMSGESSAFQKSFFEFKKVQRTLRSQIPMIYAICNEVMRPVEYGKIAALKVLGKSRLEPHLKKIWIKWKRL